MTSPSLTVSCSNATAQSPFSYSLGCSPTADTWTVANSPALPLQCATLRSQSPFQDVLTGDCTSGTSSTGTVLITSDGDAFVTNLSEFIIIA